MFGRDTEKTGVEGLIGKVVGERDKVGKKKALSGLRDLCTGEVND